MDAETKHLRAVMALARVEDLTKSIPQWTDLADVVWLLRTLQAERRLPAPMRPLTEPHGLTDGMRVRLTPAAREWFPLVPTEGLCVSAHPLAGRCAVRFDGEPEPRLIACEWVVSDEPPRW